MKKETSTFRDTGHGAKKSNTRAEPAKNQHILNRHATTRINSVSMEASVMNFDEFIFSFFGCAYPLSLGGMKSAE